MKSNIVSIIALISTLIVSLPVLADRDDRAGRDADRGEVNSQQREAELERSRAERKAAREQRKREREAERKQRRDELRANRDKARQELKRKQRVNRDRRNSGR